MAIGSVDDSFFPKYHSALFNNLMHTQVNLLDSDTLTFTIKHDSPSSPHPPSITSSPHIPQQLVNSDNHTKRPRTNSLGVEYKSVLFNELITSQVDGEEDKEASSIQVSRHNKYIYYPPVKLSDALSEEAIMQLSTLKLSSLFESPVCNIGK